ncbi:MAG: hypothetical protein WBI40_04080 [Methylococcaceae bacterium]
MNISAIQKFSPNVGQQITANNDVTNFVCSSAYFIDLIDTLNNFLKPVLQAKTGRVLEQGYVKTYTKPPAYCQKSWNSTVGNIPTLLFAPLDNPDRNGKINAVKRTWIAKLPLLPNRNSVSIYFPSSIIVDYSLFRIEQYDLDDEFDYAIPLVLSSFMKNPNAFLSIEKIKARINR